MCVCVWGGGGADGMGDGCKKGDGRIQDLFVIHSFESNRGRRGGAGMGDVSLQHSEKTVSSPLRRH